MIRTAIRTILGIIRGAKGANGRTDSALTKSGAKELCNDVTKTLNNAFRLYGNVLRLLSIVTDILRNLFRFLTSYLLLNVSFFSIDSSIFRIFYNRICSFILS